jgi:biotin operon repressor
MTVLERLGPNPQTLKEIAQECGLSRRAVEQEINRLRLEGFPVVTNGDGAWLATRWQEVELCVRRLRRRYMTQAQTARAMRKTARRMEAEQAVPLAFTWPDAA